MTADGSGDRAQGRERLSALMDGELPSSEVAQGCARWRHDADQQQAWREWSLIGDVMRSDDLAATPGRQDRLFAAIQARLAQEPVVLAPSESARLVAEVPLTVSATEPVPLAAVSAARRAWRWPVAMAAGVCMVAGGALVLRTGTGGESLQEAWVASAGLGALQPSALSASGPVMVRSPELDRYLQAHRQFSQGAGLTLAAPGAVRPVSVTQELR
ncbi:sigma-E factor negative regulatory protein [Ideonella livida]|uniref:Sigma-E factor negative regulatory protein n=1 Tax=Ideonella livida TaxID=2707176 RepID=A0A7C9PH71_9BURK|nr:sigma-E factor negative regulatory protein [Ideonella livida]NDY91609.1 sigma-E factor negative regulatory protein [Ideonella livida]